MVDKQAHPTIHRYQQNPNLFTISNRKNNMQIKVSKHIHIHSSNNLSKQVLSVIKLALEYSTQK